MVFMKLKYLSYLIICLILLAISAGTYYGFTPAPYIPNGLWEPHEVNELPKIIAQQTGSSRKVQGETKHFIEQTLKSNVDGIQIPITLNNKGHIIIDSIDAIPIKEALEIIGTKKYIFLLINPDIYLSRRLCDNIAELLENNHLNDTVIFESLNPVLLWQYHSIAPYNLIMYDFVQQEYKRSTPMLKNPTITWLLSQSLIQEWSRWTLKPDILGPNINFSLPKIHRLKKLGYPIIVWSVDSDTKAENLYAIGVDGLETTKPAKLLSVVPKVESIFDASGLELAKNVQVINIEKTEDIIQALRLARDSGRKVSAYARRNSQGGQSLADNHIILNLKHFNKMRLLEDGKTLNVQAGATWEEVQIYLAPLGRAVKVMQPDNMFAVGSTASVNGFGWQVSAGPFASTVQSLKLALASGEIIKCSKKDNSKLFSAALGGYGLLGIITELNIETVPNFNLNRNSSVISSNDFPDKYAMNVTLSPKAELAYGRLDADSSHLFYDILLIVYSRDKDLSVESKPLNLHNQIALKKQIHAITERNDEGRHARWSLERNFYGLMPEQVLSRNEIMTIDLQNFWPYSYNNTEVMQAYFIPTTKLNEFLTTLKELIPDYDLDLLVATISTVKEDDLTLLSYAKQDVFAISLTFSQATTAEADNIMHQFTQKVVAKALDLRGSFYLPFRTNYTKLQLEQAYPNLKEFLQLKSKYDPQELFVNNWYLSYVKH